MTELEVFLNAVRGNMQDQYKKLPDSQSNTKADTLYDPYQFSLGKLSADLLNRRVGYAPDKHFSVYADPFVKKYGNEEDEDYYVENRKAGARYKNKGLTVEASTDGSGSIGYKDNIQARYSKEMGVDATLKLLKNLFGTYSDQNGLGVNYKRDLGDYGYSVGFNPQRGALNWFLEGKF